MIRKLEISLPITVRFINVANILTKLRSSTRRGKEWLPDPEYNLRRSGLNLPPNHISRRMKKGAPPPYAFGEPDKGMIKVN
jgi:hypothetical protein